jgi:hypothetical protein
MERKRDVSPIVKKDVPSSNRHTNKEHAAA